MMPILLRMKLKPREVKKFEADQKVRKWVESGLSK